MHRPANLQIETHIANIQVITKSGSTPKHMSTTSTQQSKKLHHLVNPNTPAKYKLPFPSYYRQRKSIMDICNKV